MISTQISLKYMGCTLLRPCGHGPSYSGKLIARAVQLYREGVKPGYIRWEELQYTLEKGLPQEFKAVGQDRPSPETVLRWVKKYGDAPEKLKELRVQEYRQGYLRPQVTLSLSAKRHMWPLSVNLTGAFITLFGYLVVMMLASAIASGLNCFARPCRFSSA